MLFVKCFSKVYYTGSLHTSVDFILVFGNQQYFHRGYTALGAELYRSWDHVPKQTHFIRHQYICKDFWFAIET